MADEAHEEDHDHGELSFEKTEVADEVLEKLDKLHPSLAENLRLARRFAELSDDEKVKLGETQRIVETAPGWKPGYHAEGDSCVTCGEPVEPIFSDVFEGETALAYGAFHFDLPVHLDAACIDAVPEKFPRPAPQILDRARRGCMPVGGRPTAGVTQFFRHDVLVHPPFGLEDWANSVSDANPDGLDRATKKDMERLLVWVHGRLFH